MLENMGNSKGKRLLERYKRRWENNVKIYLREQDMKNGMILCGSVCGPLVCFYEHSNELRSSLEAKTRLAA